MTDNTQTIRTIDEMMEHIAQDNHLIELLHSFEIADVEKITGIEKYRVNNYRASLIITVQERKLAAPTKILIDLRKGDASVDQVHDALYGKGHDCEIKIIIDTNGEGEYDVIVPIVDRWTVLELISTLQEKNIPILLLDMNETTLDLEYMATHQDWPSVNRFKHSRPIPSREQFTAETFWSVYFDSNNGPFRTTGKFYNGQFMDIKNSWITIYTEGVLGGELRPYWDKNGLRYEITQMNDSAEYLKKILDTLMPELKNRYGESNVEFENVVGKLPRLYIKYSDEPFSWLYDADPVEITEFAGKVFDDIWDLRSKLDEAEELLFQSTAA